VEKRADRAPEFCAAIGIRKGRWEKGPFKPEPHWAGDGIVGTTLSIPDHIRAGASGLNELQGVFRLGRFHAMAGCRMDRPLRISLVFPAPRWQEGRGLRRQRKLMVVAWRDGFKFPAGRGGASGQYGQQNYVRLS